MIRRSPVEYFLKYLVVQPGELTNEQIKERLIELGLDHLGEYYIDKLREKLRPPKPFYPTDKLHFRSQRFLLKEGIQEFFFPDADTSAAYRALDFPRVKEFLETMLISYAPPVAIAHALTTRLHFKISERGVDIYKLYFWNVDLLDSVQMRALLKMRPQNAAAHSNPDIIRQADHLKAAGWNDPRRAAADMPFSPLTAVMTQIRMGMAPAQMNLPKVLSAVREMAAITALEALHTNGMHDSQKARDLGDLAYKMTEILEVVVRPDENMREQLSQIAMRTDEKEVPFIHKLSAGKHTVDMQPMPKGSTDDESGTDFEPVPGTDGEGVEPPR